MSSHHIIREKQEPALLVLSMDNFDDELFGQLLEWSPTIMAVSAVAEKLNAYGIKVDWIVGELPGDMQSDVKVLPVDDGPLIKTALAYLVANNYPSVNVVTDEVVLDDYRGVIRHINLVILSGNEKVYPVYSGFSKWKPAGDVITLLDRPVSIETEGLQSIAYNQFQTVADGFFALRFDGAPIFIAERL